MCDHFVLHQYLCGTTLYCTVHLISTYVGPLCIDHFVLHCLPHQYQYLCGTTLYCTVYLISTYVGPLCKSRYYLISTYVCDHFVLHCLCGTTLYCISTYVGPLCIALHQYLCGTTLYCTVYFTSTYLDHFVLQQYVYTSSVGLSACVTTLYCTVTVYLINTYVGLLCTYVGPLCVVLFTSSVPMWDHFALHQYLCGTTLYFTVYFTSTYLDHFVLQQ